MKRNFFIFVSTLSLLASVFLPIASFAQVQYDIGTQAEAFAGNQGANFLPYQDPRVSVARLIKGGLTMVGTLFLVYAVYAGYLMLTSAGSEEKMTKGMSTIRTGIIGILVTLSAYAIVSFVSNALLKAPTPPSSNSDLQIRRTRPVGTPSNDPYATPNGGFIPQGLY